MDKLDKFGCARVVGRPNQDLSGPDPEVGSYLAELEQAGIRTLVVLTADSFRSRNPDGAKRTEIAAMYAGQLDPDAWQIGNEPDAGFDPRKTDAENRAAERQPQHESSWCMDPDDYADLVDRCATAIRSVHPTATIISAGMVSGSPDYVARCGPLAIDAVDGIAVHPYGQRPQPTLKPWKHLPGNFGFVGSLLTAYGIFGKPLWVTETGVNVAEVRSLMADAERAGEPPQETPEEFQARYCRLMMRHLRNRPDVEAALWFCYSDGMVAEFGLVAGDGTPKPAFDAFPTN